MLLGKPARRDRRWGIALAAAGVVGVGAIAVHARGGSASPPAPPRAAPPTTPAAPPAPPPPPAPPEVDLDHVALVGDHYEAPLKDGRRAILTLDPALQQTAELLLDQALAPRAGIVALAPDGRVLALAGRRTEDPKGHDGATPDWHMVTDVWAPAASVFKLVTASALVESGYDPDATVCFHGGLRSVQESNLVDSKRDYACKSLVFGVAHSNNAILGKLAYQHLEPAKLAEVAHDLGLGAPLPASLDLPGTFADLALPTTKDLDFARSAAGFLGSRLSVMGGALLAATFADGGEQPAPHLIASIIGGATPPVPAAHRVEPEAVAAAVKRMMIATCASGSAAKSFRRRSYEAAGKTGTLTTTEPFYMENSWFVGFAPADHPEIIVSVWLGNPESWQLRAHQAARKLIDRAVRHEPDHDGKVAHRAAKHVR
jgi:cell division protein FtsI/penicillin-binding protein 2